MKAVWYARTVPWSLTASSEHDLACDLVGDHVAERPARELHRRPHRGVAQLGAEAEPHPGPPERRQQRQRHGRDAGGGAEPDQQQEGGVVVDLLEVERPRHEGRRQGEDGDDDDVVQHRRPRRGEEATAGVQQRRAERHRPVEEDLGDEEEAEGDAHPAEGGGVDVGVDVLAVEQHEGRRGDEGQGGERGEGHQRHRHHRIGGAPVVVLEVLGEQRDEGGGEDPAQDQLVDDVRRVVGQQVDVAQVAGQAPHHQRAGPRR